LLQAGVFCLLLFSFRPPIAPLKILSGDLRKQRVGKHIFLAIGKAADFFARRLQAGREQIGGTAADGFFLAEYFLLNLLANGSGGSP